MMPRAIRSISVHIAAGAVLALAATSPSLAQGKSQQSHGKSSPPSRSTLPPPTAIGGTAGTTPFAWVDDASLLSPGDVWIGLSMLRWQGVDATEVDAPVIDAAVGLSPRFQLGASAPRIIGSSDPGGVEGGMGTTYVHGKITLFKGARYGLRVAVSPTVEILGASALAAAPDQNRVHWGAPVSGQIDVGSGRVYASTGFFSRGVWFFGAGAAAPVTPKIGVSASFSRSWSTTTSTDPSVAAPNRNELSGGVSYALSPVVGLFGSVGHTVATTDADGAGATMSIGVSFMLRADSIRN
jgi:hypothetical protein